MTLESLLADLPADWYLYQLGYTPTTSSWSCHLRNPIGPWVTYGQGPTISDALSMAIDAIYTAPLPAPASTTYSIAPEFNLESILGLRPKSALGEEIARRFNR